MRFSVTLSVEWSRARDDEEGGDRETTLDSYVENTATPVPFGFTPNPTRDGD